MQAAKAPKASKKRLLLVTVFNIFGWTGHCMRTEFKAMRAMDGETFDFVSPEHGFTFLIEFVSDCSQDQASMPMLPFLLTQPDAIHVSPKVLGSP